MEGGFTLNFLRDLIFNLMKLVNIKLFCSDNLNMTKDLKRILNALPKKRQTLLFTATNTPVVGETIAACPNNPFVYESADMNEKKTVGTLDQKYILTTKECKDVYLVYLVLENR